MNPDSLIDFSKSRLLQRYPTLTTCSKDIISTVRTIYDTFSSGGKLLVMGNGGSSCDAEHFCGELIKGFLDKRKIVSGALYDRLESVEKGLAAQLQGSLPAISLGVAHGGISAINNDMNPEYVFAQQILGLANDVDTVFGISTSGNSKNVYRGLQVAKAKGAKTIVMTGGKPSLCSEIADITIRTPASYVHEIQELHLPVYHAICLELEHLFFGENL